MLSLFDCIKETGFHSSIMTTFCMDASFYEANVQYRLRASGCKNNTLLVDRAMFSQELATFPTAFKRAGSSYLLHPVSSLRAFHPKIILRYGKNKADLIVGSANVTATGWGVNQEILGRAIWNSKVSNQENDGALLAISKAHKYLDDLLSKTDDENWRYKRALIRKECSWLNDLPLADESAPLLLGGSGLRGLMDQLLDLIDIPIQRLLIISPYWDQNLAALKTLRSRLGNPALDVVLRVGNNEAKSSRFPVSSLDASAEVKFFRYGKKDNGRFLHSKIFLFQGQKEEYAVFGSANCTMAAFGGKNDEAVWFQKFERGSLESLLGLNKIKKLPRSEILEPEDDDEEEAETQGFNPGQLSWRSGKVFWSAKPSKKYLNAKLLLDENKHDVAGTTSLFFYVSSARMRKPAIAKVKLANGEISSSTIISFEEELKLSSPSSINRHLESRLKEILNGQVDFLEIANDIDLIFGSHKNTKPTGLRTTGSRSKSENSQGNDFESSEAFRNAIVIGRDPLSSRIMHADNPALNYVMRIILRGISDIPDSNFSDAEISNSIRGSAEGDFQDEEDYEDDDIDKQTVYEEDAELASFAVSLSDFEKSRSLLVKTAESFYNELRSQDMRENDIHNDFITKSILILSLLLHGVTQKYSIEGKDRTLLEMDIGHDRDKSFPILAGRLTKTLWEFLSSKNAFDLYNRPKVSFNDVSLRTLVSLSKWTMGLLMVFSRENKSLGKLATMLESQIPPVFAKMLIIYDQDMEQQSDMITGFMERAELGARLQKMVWSELARLSSTESHSQGPSY